MAVMTTVVAVVLETSGGIGIAEASPREVAAQQTSVAALATSASAHDHRAAGRASSARSTVVSSDAATRDEHADSSRAIPAYRSPSSEDRIVRIFSVTFRAVAGERRLIAGKIIARQPSSTPDSALMAAASVTCSPANDIPGAGATENVLRGRTSTLTPRFVYVAPRTGTVTCAALASGLRPRPVSRGYASSNVWVVDSGSYLSVSAPLGSWARTVDSDATSRVVEDRGSWTALSRIVRVRAGRSFQVVTDHKVTTCSSVGGSRDSSTGGREICAGHVSTRGSIARAIVTVVQLADSGQACSAPQVITGSRKVTPMVHHAMLAVRGVVTVDRSAACGDRFWIRSSLRHDGGAAFAVHAPSERATVLPR